MRAMVIEEFGSADRLRFVELPCPTPAPGEVLIELRYAGVNPVDWQIREGHLKELFPHQFPLIPGWDAAGVVAACGAGVRHLKVGEAVYAYCRKSLVKWGTYAEYVTVDAAAVAPMPANLSFAQAAVIPLAGLTAYQSLFDFARLTAGQSILIHAGAGGVGSMAIQFARHIGATVITTASARNHDYVRGLGAQQAIDYTAGDFVAAVKQQMPGGVDVVFDAIGGVTQRQSYEVLKPGGTLVSIVEPPSQQVMLQYNFHAGYVFVSPNGRQLHEITRLIEAGAVKAPRIKEMHLKDAAKAQELSRDGHVGGKLVLRILDEKRG